MKTVNCRRSGSITNAVGYVAQEGGRNVMITKLKYIKQIINSYLKESAQTILQRIKDRSKWFNCRVFTEAYYPFVRDYNVRNVKPFLTKTSISFYI